MESLVQGLAVAAAAARGLPARSLGAPWSRAIPRFWFATTSNRTAGMLSCSGMRPTTAAERS